MNPELSKINFELEFNFGTSMFGETFFPNDRNNKAENKWDSLFASEFYLNLLQYYFILSTAKD